ncbi:hypothetical protein [Microbacterium jejuense]|uniref:hypothetical protein n=1 Tax=Microbacterium jejuense TaxID=1263637 RepID=UPI0031E8A13C
MPEARKKKFTFTALAGALIAAALVVAPMVTAGASATTLKGEVGTIEAQTPKGNNTPYWEDRYAEFDVQCFKHDGTGSNEHGSVSADRKTVTLKQFDQNWWGNGWVVLVINAGTSNNVIENPKAGVAYASPVNNGGNQANVSHWIVCKGTTPEQPQNPTPAQDLDCVAITADYGRALTNGDHINITYDEAAKKQVNAYVDLNVAGGWKTLGIRFSDGTTKPLTESDVKSGKIAWAYSELIPAGKYTISFVQTNQTDTYPNLTCGEDEQPVVVTPSVTYAPGTCLAEGSYTLSQNADWTPIDGEDGSTIWHATPKDGSVFAEDAEVDWPIPSLAQRSADDEDCRPAKPEPKQTVTVKTTFVCESPTATVVTTTTTSLPEWDFDAHAWVYGTPTSVDTTSTRPLTDAEQATCPPDTEVTYGAWEDGTWACGDTTVAQTRVVTTLVDGVATDSTTETRTRDLAQAEIGTCPLVPGDIDSVCVGDVPYLSYEVMLPEGFVADGKNPVTITFVNPDGADYVVTGKPLSGKILWPGASDGEPKMWPGWDLVDGQYVQTDGNFAWTRDETTVRFDVNPTYSTVVVYPQASAECANPPVGSGEEPEEPTVPGEPEEPTAPVEPGTPTETTTDDSTDTPSATPSATPVPAAEGSDGDLAVTGGGVSPIVVAAGGAALAVGVAVVAIAAYRRRRAGTE